MPVDRIHWVDLPEQARNAVEQHTGPILNAQTATAGANSGIATTLHTLSTSVFVKGVPADHPQARTQQREADIAPHLPPSCPRLLWRVQTAGWDLLGYEHFTGRHADYSPDSADLPLIAAAVNELQSAPCPPIGLKQADQRWAAYTTTPEPFAGQTLLHTDLAPHNVLISDRAHLIDWAWPTRGAAWIDPAVLILRLMEAGHTAPTADHWTHTHIPSWQAAPPVAVTAFSAANATLWDDIARKDAQDWKKNMARHAHDWLTYWRSSTK
ncbi:aminoglycoside phosphotransferase [Streptomyces sp. NPDC020917]|uniref:aminoglycoside phosphotransferase n=1 Tax=Streptomyces sp. NPDC020917 TaxID=3365102 RepID=UPI0037A09770